MEHKLIMENWRKYVNESAAGAALDIASGTKDTLSVDDVSDIALMFIKYFAEALGIVSKNMVSAASNVSLLPGTSASAALGGALSRARNLNAALAEAGLLSKLKILLKDSKWARLLVQKMGSLAVAKGLARVLPPVAIALEIYDIVNLWNRETKGVNTWGLALDALRGNHMVAKDLSKEKRAKQDRIRPTTDNFDKWDEETQVGWCVRNSPKKAPDDFEGTLTCKVVLQRANKELIQRAKTVQGKIPAGKTDAGLPMSVPAE